jgi:sirohydrochlorin cobaltochelatase
MLILIAHGSRNPAWRRSVEGLATAVQKQLLGEEVRVAFMQFEGPTLPEVVAEAVRSGETRLRLLPLFMASAGHVDNDVRPLVDELAGKHTPVELELLDPVGENNLFPGLLVDILTGPERPS